MKETELSGLAIDRARLSAGHERELHHPPEWSSASFPTGRPKENTNASPADHRMAGREGKGDTTSRSRLQIMI
jgi:hypothetical protein